MVWVIIWDANKAIDIWEWPTCVSGWLERFNCSSQLWVLLAIQIYMRLSLSMVFFNGSLREFEYHYRWDQNKEIEIREWSVPGGGLLERFYCSSQLCAL